MRRTEVGCWGATEQETRLRNNYLQFQMVTGAVLICNSGRRRAFLFLPLWSVELLTRSHNTVLKATFCSVAPQHPGSTVSLRQACVTEG
jgi:hypothetical protein